MSNFFPASKNNKDPIGFIANPLSETSALAGIKLPLSVLENLPEIEFGMWRINSPYGCIMNANVIFGGIGYAESTSLTVSSEPEHSEGTAAVLSPILGLSPLSLNIEGGSGHAVGDVYIISNTDSTSPALIEIKEVDNDGAIVDWHITDSGENFTNDSSLDIVLVSTEIKTNEVVQPTIELIPDKFTIADVKIENAGSGYMFWDETGDQMPINRTIVVSDGGDGYGFIGTVDQANVEELDEEALVSQSTNRSRKSYINKYGKVSFPNEIFLNTRYKSKTIVTESIITHEAITSTTLSNGIVKL